MSIKRYTFDPDTYSGSGCECSIEECKQGEYVCSEDYDKLQAQLEAVLALSGFSVPLAPAMEKAVWVSDIEAALETEKQSNARWQEWSLRDQKQLEATEKNEEILAEHNKIMMKQLDKFRTMYIPSCKHEVRRRINEILDKRHEC